MGISKSQGNRKHDLTKTCRVDKLQNRFWHESRAPKERKIATQQRKILYPQLLNFVADTNTNLKIKLLAKIHNSTSEDLMTSIESD
jgi:hypothetical protein